MLRQNIFKKKKLVKEWITLHKSKRVWGEKDLVKKIAFGERGSVPRQAEGGKGIRKGQEKVRPRLVRRNRNRRTKRIHLQRVSGEAGKTSLRREDTGKTLKGEDDGWHHVKDRRRERG